MRAQYPFGGDGEAGGWRRQLLGEEGGQVQEIQADAAARLAGGGAADCRVLRQSRMQGGRYADGEQVQLLRAGGGQGLDRPINEKSAHAASSRQGCLHGGRRYDQAAVQDEVTRAVLAPHQWPALSFQHLIGGQLSLYR